MKPKLLDIISAFKGRRVVVLGDLILDTYLSGKSTRLCPEAPVPVVDLADERSYAGGAANSAVNLKKLGCEVVFCSVCGNDTEGKKAGSILRHAGIASSSLYIDRARSTIEKTRVMAGGHMLARVDKGTQSPLGAEAEAAIIGLIQAALKGADALLVADYNKGLITPAVIKAISALRTRSKVFLAVDSSRLALYSSLKPDLVKPNSKEALSLLGLDNEPLNRIKTFTEIGGRLSKITNSRHVALTLDHDGVLLFDKQRSPEHIESPFVEKPSVSGAGDTFLAAATLSAVCGALMGQAAEIGCAAASVAIARTETSYCSYDELRTFFSRKVKLVDSNEELARLCTWYHESGKRIVFTNGCFDILHSGHVAYLSQAKSLGDILIVGLNNDASISRLKGASRPINQLEDRVEVLSALSSIDHVVPFGMPGDDTPTPLISLVKPHVFVKGGDYTIGDLPEAPVVKKFGGTIRILPFLEGHSTTATIRKMTTMPQAAGSSLKNA